MRSSLTVVVLGLLSVVAFTDTVSAGLFGRVRARRTAAMRAEVASQVAGQVSVAEGRLGETLDAQLAEEASKLSGQVEAGLAKLQEQAQQMLATESRKIEQQLTEQLAKLHATAQETLTAESAKLRQEVEAQVAKLEADANAQIKDALAKLDNTMSQGMKEAQDAALAARTASTDMRAEVEKLKSEVTELVKIQLSATAPAAPADAPQPPEAPQESAIQPAPVRLEEEKAS